MPATDLSKDTQVLLLRSILEEPMDQIASPFPPLVLSRKDIGFFHPPAYQRSNLLFYLSCPYLLRLFFCFAPFSSTNTPIDFQNLYCIYFLT